MNGFKLIIFDCDGVLVDSERLANQVFASILQRECGLSFSQDDMFDTFVGHSSTQCMEIIADILGKEPPNNLETLYKTEITAALAQDVVAVRGIEKALAEISAPFCVASSGSHEKMRITLGKTNLLSTFAGNIFSTSDVRRGKPSPDIYLHAAANMGNVPPKQCLVIEDSPLGVQGAVAAGMTVFGYAELMKAHSLTQAGAHHLFKDMANLAHEILSFQR
ncbi:HAD family hydrolase [Leptothoe kymatousa]|uniref:HAD family hydrolase n=1 Tax=Leptothoe kymatousa TAU-MAC 1615 TaxID=2364775 RepID=A0ABS5Y1P9_9CYAN|nr:HAD family hydrolase [Leptothoe kymatousa]MBT9311712.1 HAD family hydrolase [Leptothoe kymatousa TAU-MAC 1615]